MNRIDQLFQTKKSGLLSLYFCAGYPTLNTADVIIQVEQAGIDFVEVGIPFSDPMADGAVIQHAATQALRNGMSLRLLFEQLQNIRQQVALPLIFMGYLNPIMSYGFERFCADCSRIGIDGVIIPDLPFADYTAHYKDVAQAHGVRVIMLITPETSEERIRLIDSHTDGFIYMVSSASTTGAQSYFDEQKQAYFNKVNNMQLKNPRMIGFGISNAATLQAAQANAAGAIIGSKFVSLQGESTTTQEALTKLFEALKQ